MSVFTGFGVTWRTAAWNARARASVPVVSITVAALEPMTHPALFRNQLPSSWM
jgi:hypothetical protein